jgi:hypothetical protein
MGYKARLAVVAAVVLTLVGGCQQSSCWRSTTSAAEPPYVKPERPAPASGIQQASGGYVAPQNVRVQHVAAQLVQANAVLGLRPKFEVVPGDQKMLRREGHRIVVSEALVDACETDGQLAALLALELGQMVADRQAARSEPENVAPPPEVHIGGPDGGGFGPQLRQAELAKLGLDRRRPPAGVPDVQTLACQILSRSGFDPKEVQRALPLWRQ